MKMKAKAILDDIVRMIREIPEKLSGDDSPLANPWEEIKEQLQHEMSYYWQAYLDTMKGIIGGTVSSLSNEDRAALAAELRVPPEDSERLHQTILNRLIARARKEKIKYAPFDFQYFTYSIDGMRVYAKVVARTGLFTCDIVAYSGAAPSGERGKVDTDIIEEILSRAEFEAARQQKWPD
jgi:hypothetical protein